MLCLYLFVQLLQHLQMLLSRMLLLNEKLQRLFEDGRLLMFQKIAFLLSGDATFTKQLSLVPHHSTVFPLLHVLLLFISPEIIVSELLLEKLIPKALLLLRLSYILLIQLWT